MVQDIAAKKLYNEYTNKRPAQTDYMVVFQQKKILARKLHGRICLPRLSVFWIYAQERYCGILR